MAKVDWSQFTPVEPEAAKVDWSQFTPVDEKPAPAKERTWTEAGSDTIKSLGQGLIDVGGVLPGVAYGAATGNYDNAWLNTARGMNEIIDEGKSAALKAHRKQVDKKLENAEGFLQKLVAGAVETASDPTVLLDTLARSAPGMLAGGVAGRGAGALADVAANTAIKGASSIASPLATAGVRIGAAVPKIAGSTATGTAAAVQGTSVAADTYEAAMKLPMENFEAMPEFAELAAQHGAGAAKSMIASDAANKAGAGAAAASLLFMKLPGGDAIEKMLLPKAMRGAAAPAATGAFTKPLTQGMAGGAGAKAAELLVQGFNAGAKEFVSEGGEEGAGAALKALKLSGLGQDVNLAEETGLAAGQGGVVGHILGGAAGMREAYTEPTPAARVAPTVEAQPTTPVAPVVNKPQAAQAVDAIGALLGQTQTPTSDAGPAAATAAPGVQPDGGRPVGQADAPTASEAAAGPTVANPAAAISGAVSNPASAIPDTRSVTDRLAEIEKTLAESRARQEEAGRIVSQEAQAAEAKRLSEGNYRQQTADTAQPAGAVPVPGQAEAGVGEAKRVATKHGDLADRAAYSDRALYGIINNPQTKPELLDAARYELERRKGNAVAPAVSMQTTSTLSPAAQSLQQRMRAGQNTGDGTNTQNAAAPQAYTASTGRGVDPATGSSGLGSQSTAGAGRTNVDTQTPGTAGGRVAPSPASGSDSPAGRVQLKLAPKADKATILNAQLVVKRETGVAIQPVDDAHPLTEEQQIVSHLANAKGKTVTWVENSSGPADKMPDGWVNRLGGKHLFLDVNSSKPLLEILMHEGTHGLPDHIRAKLRDYVNSKVSAEGRAEFLRRYKYEGTSKGMQDEEVLAYVGQSIARKPEFLQDLKTALGNKDFSAFISHVLKRFNQLMGGKGQSQFDSEFLGKNVKDVAEIHKRLVEAYAQSMQEQGLQPDAGLVEPAFAMKAAQPESGSTDAYDQDVDRLTTKIESEGGTVQDAMQVDQLIASKDIPVIELSDLVGMDIFPTIADRTAAAAVYTGIDSSAVNVAIPLLGGPMFPLRKSNVNSGVVWANRGKGVIAQKAAKLKSGANYMMVLVGDANMHQSNTTVASAFMSTLEAYARDRRISPAQVEALGDLVRKAPATPEIKGYLENFPGFDDIEILHAYMDGMSFDARKRVLNLMASKEALALGAPSMQKILDATREPSLSGHRWGDAVLLVEVDQKNPQIELGTNGTTPHPDFPVGVRGKVVGRLSTPLSWETLWKDWLSENKGAAPRRAFELSRPIVKVTQELVDSIGPIKQSNIDGHRQARLAADFAAGNWKTSDNPVNRNGVSPQEFVDAIQASTAKDTLTQYTLAEVKAGLKDKSMRLFQLGQDGQIFFMLKKEGDKITLASVVNNEQGARGIGAPAVVLKAIEEGATDLDCFAVTSDRFPYGFLPSLYAAFGFRQVGESSPYNSEYFPGFMEPDAIKYWKESTPGFDPSKGMPSLVEMKWSGKDEERTGISERYLRSGFEGLYTGGAHSNARGFVAELRKSNRQPTGRIPQATPNSGGAGGDQGAAAGALVSSRARSVVRSIADLSDNEAKNLGLSGEDVAATRSKLQFANKQNLDQDITLEIPLDNGKTAKLTVNAQTYIKQLDARQSALEMVKECMA